MALIDSTLVTSDVWQPILDAITAQISPTTIIMALASVIGASIGCVFMWWGLRKAKNALMAGALKGKLKF